MIDLLLLLLGITAGFIGSRTVRKRARRPEAPGGPLPAVGSAAAVASAARSVGGTLGRRKGLTPPELQRACFGELVRHVHRSRKGPTVVPNRFLIDLHPDDLATVDESRRWFTEGLVDALRDAARQNGWQLTGEVAIVYQSDPARRPGVPAAHPVGGAPGEAGLVDGPAASAPGEEGPVPAAAAASGHLVLVRSDTGERIEVDPSAGPLVIGRSRAADVMVDDNRVSRQHAQVEATADGGWTVTDLGSSNGTVLDSRTLVTGQPRAVKAASVIQVGPVRFRAELP